MSALTIGLTGGLAGGKSTVADLLRRRGWLVVDADRLVAELYAPGEPGAAVVRDLFGDSFLDEAGAVDHARLASRIFSDPDSRARLEAAIHPLVRERFARLAAATDGIAALEATLLVEAGHAPDFDQILTVEAAAATRLARAVARGLDEPAARARLAAQGDGARRRSQATHRIDNDGTLDELERCVDRVAGELEAATPPLSALPTEAILITGNRGKLAEARRLCGFPLDAIAIDLPELQSLDILEVLRAKGRDAWLRVRQPILVEETGLELAGMNGFPGPLVKWMLEAVGGEGIAAAARATSDDRAIARCCLLYFDGETEVIGSGHTDGRLVLPGRGREGFGWDPVFQPVGSELTYAEMTAAEKDHRSHRAHAWADLLAQFR